MPIGFVYCNSDDLVKAQEIVSDLNTEKLLNSKSKVKLEIKSLRLNENDNPMSLSLSVCENLMNKDSIYAVIIASSDCLAKKRTVPNGDRDYLLTISSISFACAYYKIPVIDLSHREAEFSDKVTRQF